MALTVLLSTSLVSAQATLARLQALEIDAVVIDDPNVFVRLASGGNYRVRVAVPEEEFERARGELARWDASAGPRVDVLARELRLGFFLGSLPALALLLWLLVRHQKNTGLWLAIAPAWLGGLMAWALWSRRRAIRRAKPAGKEEKKDVPVNAPREEGEPAGAGAGGVMGRRRG